MLDWTVVDEISSSFHTERLLHPRDNRMVRISSIGDCRRKMAYRIQGHNAGRDEGPMDSHLLSIFDLGHAMHLQLQTRFSNVGPLKWIDADPALKDGHFAWAGNCELAVDSPEDWYAGHLDGLTRPLKRVPRLWSDTAFETIEVTGEDDPDGRRYILDIKTITGRPRLVIDKDPQTGRMVGAKEWPSAFEKLKEMKEEHRGQVSLYAHAVTRPHFQTERLPGPLAVPPGLMLIYVAKDLSPDYYRKYPKVYAEPRGLLNAPFKVFVEDTDPKLVRALLKKIQGVKAHVEAGTLPPRDYHHLPERPAWPCVDCPFNQTCYAKEGYFDAGPPAVPARLGYHLAQIDAGKAVLG